ncbi:MAG: addiction module antitoxin RelB [Methylophaga sp.]|nr:MAG: addiction module antitoxin RelB [Methylophaga sp.]
MNLKHIEDEALHLTGQERAALAQKLLLSLDSSSEDELSIIWLNEAVNRAKDLENGSVQPISAEAVRLKAQALLR